MQPAAFRTFVAIFILVALSASTSFALPNQDPGPTIGPELSFASAHTRDSSRKHKARHAWLVRLNKLTLGLWRHPGREASVPTADGEHVDAIALKNRIMSQCAECEVTTRKGKWRLDEFLIKFPNGYWIVISVDPGRVEVQTAHLPYDDYEYLEEFVEENLYAAAAAEGLEPVTDNDGHTNIGILSAFKTVGQFAEFLLDEYNHPELGLGVLGFDLRNAPHLIYQQPDQIEAFSVIMNEVKSGALTTHKQLAQNINQRAYKTTNPPKGVTSSIHYQAVGLKRAESPGFPLIDAPLELRITAARKNFARVLLNYKLFVKRIKFLNQRPEFTNLRRDLDRATVDAMSPSEKLSRFYIFVTEMGEPFKPYRYLIYDREILKASLDSFVSGQLNADNSVTAAEFLRYVPDLEISSWVREQMRSLLKSATTPTEIKVVVVTAIATRLARTGMRQENKKVLAEFFEELKPVRHEINKAGPVKTLLDEQLKVSSGCPKALSNI